VTAINAPAGIESTKIVKEMRARFGAILTDGQGSMKGHMFRIAHLGYYDFLDVVAVLGGLEIVLQKVGHKVELGSGVRAAQNVYLRHSS
jgi:aspartate aminotransferase-like enzyme